MPHVEEEEPRAYEMLPGPTDLNEWAAEWKQLVRRLAATADAVRDPTPLERGAVAAWGRAQPLTPPAAARRKRRLHGAPLSELEPLPGPAAHPAGESAAPQSATQSAPPTAARDGAMEVEPPAIVGEAGLTAVGPPAGRGRGPGRADAAL